MCGVSELIDAWSEETIKTCLYLFLGLLPVDHHLIHDLANVYTASVADIKRTILRVLETPVRSFSQLYQMLNHVCLQSFVHRAVVCLVIQSKY